MHNLKLWTIRLASRWAGALMGRSLCRKNRKTGKLLSNHPGGLGADVLKPLEAVSHRFELIKGGDAVLAEPCPGLTRQPKPESMVAMARAAGGMPSSPTVHAPSSRPTRMPSDVSTGTRRSIDSSAPIAAASVPRKSPIR